MTLETFLRCTLSVKWFIRITYNRTDCLLKLSIFRPLKTSNNSFTIISLNNFVFPWFKWFLLIVLEWSFFSSHNFVQRLFTSHLISSRSLLSTRIMILNILTLSFLFWQSQLLILLFLLMNYPTASHFYKRARWKDFNKHFSICVQIFEHFPLRYFALVTPMTNIDFTFFSPFGLPFLRSSDVIVFLANYNYCPMMFRLLYFYCPS